MQTTSHVCWHVQAAAKRPQAAPSAGDAHKRFTNEDKINIKAQLVFDTCWRKLEGKWSGVNLGFLPLLFLCSKLAQ